MRLQLVRSATLILEYAGHQALIDPDFAAKHARESLAGRSLNPMVDLPISVEQILEGVELVIVSHLHRDHFDVEAQRVIPKHLPVLCQPSDKNAIQNAGFRDVTSISNALQWKNICITRTEGQHGLGDVGAIMGRVSGFVLESAHEPTLYWAGDTVLTEEVRAAITRFEPDIIVLHACGATWPDAKGAQRLIVMDEDQALEVTRLAPNATIVVTHLESLDHAPVTRAGLRARALEAGIRETRFRIPADGETMELLVEVKNKVV
jgi:L-ascorbate metabolism protein UlaG (beta-lactamase superfamily)